MIRLLLAICRLLWRLRGYEVIEIPDRVPQWLEDVVWSGDAR